MPLDVDREAAAEMPPGALELAQVIKDLYLLNHNTEQGFLEIGGRLADFIGAVKAISSDLTALTDLVSGTQAQRVGQSLASARDRSIAMQGRLTDRSSGWERMRLDAGKLKQILSRFKGNASTFHALGLLTRVEIARLGGAGAGFRNLAEDVVVLSGGVQAGIETALETAAHLIPSIEVAMQEIATLEEGQAKDLPSVISDALSGLGSLQDMQSKAQNSSVRLRAQYGAISDAFGNLIFSIQFHDITRQQVEHVIQVLQRLVSEPEGANGGAEVLTLQSAQLLDAGAKFAASSAALTKTLDELAERVLAMTSESRELFGDPENKTNSSFQRTERGCTAILAHLGRSVSSEVGILAAGGGLTEMIDQMGQSITGIHEIENKMRFMAMNSRIGAHHLGPAGAVLGVLADSIQQRALESRQRSDSVGETLGSMSRAAGKLTTQSSTSCADDQPEQDSGLEEMRLAVEDLRESGERSSVQVARIASSGDRLRESLSVTRRDFSIGTFFAQTIGQARRTIDQLGEMNKCAPPHYGAGASERVLSEYAKHYTMQCEVEVYERFTGTSLGLAPHTGRIAEYQGLPGQAEELGDNVELF